MNNRIRLIRAQGKVKAAKEMCKATQLAVDTVKVVAETHRKLYHTRHINRTFSEALDRLECQLGGDRAYMTRCVFEHDVVVRDIELTTGSLL